MPWLLETTAEMFRVNKKELHLIQQWLNHVALPARRHAFRFLPRVVVPACSPINFWKFAASDTWGQFQLGNGRISGVGLPLYPWLQDIYF